VTAELLDSGNSGTLGIDTKLVNPNREWSEQDRYYHRTDHQPEESARRQ
jgi:hypothetical protein